MLIKTPNYCTDSALDTWKRRIAEWLLGQGTLEGTKVHEIDMLKQKSNGEVKYRINRRFFRIQTARKLIGRERHCCYLRGTLLSKISSLISIGRIEMRHRKD